MIAISPTKEIITLNQVEADYWELIGVYFSKGRQGDSSLPHMDIVLALGNIQPDDSIQWLGERVIRIQDQFTDWDYSDPNNPVPPQPIPGKNWFTLLSRVLTNGDKFLKELKRICYLALRQTGNLPVSAVQQTEPEP